MFGEWEEPDDPSEVENKKNVERITKRILELEEQRKNNSMEKLKMDREVAALHGDTMAQAEAELDMMNKLKNLQEEMFEKASSYSPEQKQALQDQIDMQEQLVKSILRSGETAEQAVERLRSATTGLAKAGDDAGQDFFGGIAGKMGLATKAGDNWIGKLQTISVKMKDPTFAKNFIGKFKQIFTLQNMVASGMMMVAQATIGMIMSADKAAAAFAKAHGTGTTFNDRIYKLGGNFRHLGITQEDASKAISSLYKKFPGYTKMTDNQMLSLEKTVATLDKLGVATDNSASLMSDLMKAQGLSAEAAASQTKELALMAESLQMTADEVVKGYSDARKSLAVYGSKAPKIFQNIASAAQAAGVETSKLLDLAGKFDTFNDSAEAAGKLNAILGTQFSATKMLRMEADEQIETVIRGIQASGRQFKDMDRFTQRAVAQTLGINDLNEAQKILGTDVAGYKKMQKEAAASAKEQKDMEEKAAAAMDAQQKLTMALSQMAVVLKPLMEAFQSFAQTVLDVATRYRGLVGPVVKFMLVIIMLTKLFGPLLTLFRFFTPALAGTAPAIKGVGVASSAAAGPTAAFAVGMKGIGLGAIAVGIGLAIVILAFTFMLLQLSKINEVGPGVISFMLAGAAAVYMLAGALAMVGTVGLVGVLVLGIAIGLMVWFLSATEDAGAAIEGAFTQVNAFLGQDKALTKVSDALIGLGDAFAAMQNKMSGGGLIGKGLNFLGLGSVMPTRKSPFAQMAEDLMPIILNADSLATTFEKMSEVMKSEGADGVESLKDGLVEISNLMHGDKGIKIKHTLENLALITTGKSSQMSDGFGAVLSALTKLSKSETNVLLKIDEAGFKKLVETGAVDAILEIRK